jgi:hypothetical protein
VSAHRPDILARLSALESFREERLRQSLAANHAEAEKARKQQARDESAWLEVEIAQSAVMASERVDMARYMLYALCADVTSLRLERSTEVAVQAQAQSERAAEAWAVGQARRKMVAERAEQARQEALAKCERKAAAERLDTWLAQRREP